MKVKFPKDNEKYRWTNHVKDKMLYYGISEGLIKRIVRFPKRKEEGIAPKTVAVMQSTSSGKQEVWVMYQTIGGEKSEVGSENKKTKSKIQKIQPPISNFQHPKVKIISAWRYPGVSPVGKKIPIPDEIRQELGELIK